MSDKKHPTILEHFESEISIGLVSFQDLAHRWRDSGSTFGHAAIYLFPLVQQDGWTDLILRKAESEYRNGERNSLQFADSGYMSLSRYWMLSMYEILRTYCEYRKTSNERAGDQITQAIFLRDQFALVRVALAKLEIKGANLKKAPKVRTIKFPPNESDKPEDYQRGTTPYFPVQGMDFSSGSAYWDVIDLSSQKLKRILRQKLSDDFLDTFAPRNVSN